MAETVNHPSHYTHGSFETIDAIEEWGLGPQFHIATAIKYISRAGHKGDRSEDLKKARWYVRRALSKYRMEPVLRDRLSPTALAEDWKLSALLGETLEALDLGDWRLAEYHLTRAIEEEEKT